MTDWNATRADLDERGFAVLPDLLSAPVCDHLGALYAQPDLFRSRIIMQRHAFGAGAYQYFADPLPSAVQNLRQSIYPELAPLANLWAERLGWANRFPDAHADYRAACHAAGQAKPTPLLLKYGPGDFNRLHQDMYGDLWFPIQLAVLLTARTAFEGGQFLLTETRPRMQTRAEVVELNQGDAVLFAVNQRPVPSKNGYSRVTMRHGVSTVRSGHRMTLGVIFHDAR